MQIQTNLGNLYICFYLNVFILCASIDDIGLNLLQGQSRQTGFFELALRDRNMQVRFFWKVFLKSWDLRNFASAPVFMKCIMFAIYCPICKYFLFLTEFWMALRSTFLGEWKNSCSSKTCIIRSVLCNKVFKI